MDEKTKNFIKEKQVKNYVENVCKIESQSKILIIFITGITSECRPCEKGTIALIDSIYEFKNLSGFSKYIIISDNNKDSYKCIKSDSFTVLPVSQYAIQKHGIDFPYNFVIEFDNKYKIIYWESLVSSKFKDIYNELSVMF